MMIANVHLRFNGKISTSRLPKILPTLRLSIYEFRTLSSVHFCHIVVNNLLRREQHALLRTVVVWKSQYLILWGNSNRPPRAIRSTWHSCTWFFSLQQIPCVISVDIIFIKIAFRFKQKPIWKIIDWRELGMFFSYQLIYSQVHAHTVLNRIAMVKLSSRKARE